MIKRVLSGLRTTGPTHLGHYAGALSNWVKLQDEYECFFLLADIQALTTHYDQPQRLEESVKEIVLDWLAIGVDPIGRENVHFVLQSRIPEIIELSVYFSLLIPLSYVERNPTIKTELAQHGKKAHTLGFLSYPVSQAADILVFSPSPPEVGDKLVVPVGEDQIPHIELTNVIARKFHKIYSPSKPIFLECEYLVTEVPRLVGIDGDSKMSKTLGNVIEIREDMDSLSKKVMSMFTDPTKIHLSDSGHPLSCPVYLYDKVFSKDRNLDEIKAACEQGHLGCVSHKKMLLKDLKNFLSQIQERRRYFEERLPLIKESILSGTAFARKIASNTMANIREAMHLDYRNLLS